MEKDSPLVEPSLALGHISDDFAISPQLGLRDIATLREMGYRSILILRPDGEERGQPNHVQLSDAAGRLGIETRYLPLDPEAVGPGEVRAFRLNVAAMPAPLVAMSATGRRAVALWALSMAGRKPTLEILDTALMVGHDLTDLAEVLET